MQNDLHKILLLIEHFPTIPRAHLNFPKKIIFYFITFSINSFVQHSITLYHRSKHYETTLCYILQNGPVPSGNMASQFRWVRDILQGSDGSLPVPVPKHNILHHWFVLLPFHSHRLGNLQKWNWKTNPILPRKIPTKTNKNNKTPQNRYTKLQYSSFCFFGDPAKSTLDSENWYLLPLPKTCLRESLSCSLLKYTLLGLFGFISGLWSGVILLRHASQLCEFLPNRHPAIYWWL